MDNAESNTKSREPIATPWLGESIARAHGRYPHSSNEDSVSKVVNGDRLTAKNILKAGDPTIYDYPFSRSFAWREEHTPTQPKQVIDMLDTIDHQLPRLAIAFAHNEFDRIHEPGSSPKDQITFDDLVNYRNTHTGNLAATRMVDYLLNNHKGTSSPDPKRFDLIRNMSPHDAPDNFPMVSWFGFGANADGITKYDLQSASDFLAERALKLKYPSVPDEPVIEGEKSGFRRPSHTKLDDLNNLEQEFSKIADGKTSISEFQIRKYARCDCAPALQESLVRTAQNLPAVLKHINSSSQEISLSEIKQAQSSLQAIHAKELAKVAQIKANDVAIAKETSKFTD